MDTLRAAARRPVMEIEMIALGLVSAAAIALDSWGVMIGWSLGYLLPVGNRD